ncbi:MAG: hypothetical protein JWM87_670 [Candidatus Eremiobacteraeota bacterium]|nr:hypothetical protein [Candidatus Eremiobacteraeota bacterium]
MSSPTIVEQLRSVADSRYGRSLLTSGDRTFADVASEAAALLEIDARHPAETLFASNAFYSGSTVIDRLRAHARAGRALYGFDVVEIATVHTADEANALLAVGWVLLGHAAHVGAAPDFHLGRPSSAAERVIA